MNMIIWIDGANGVGKSHVAKKLAKFLADRNAEYVESDQYWTEFLQNDQNNIFTGFAPYYNQKFLNLLREVLEEKVYNGGKMPIVSVSLVDKLCERELLDYFEKKNISMLHIILEAKKETIISRIDNDLIRDKNMREHQKHNVDEQMRYLNNEYPNAVRFNTEDKTLEEIVDEILTLL